MNHDFVDELFLKLEFSVYSKHNLVNVEELEKNKEKLLNDVQYLPYFIRIYLRDEYYNIINQNNTIYTKVKEDNEKNIKDKTQDFLTWIHEHKEYKKILDTEKQKQLNKELEEIEKEIKYIQNRMNYGGK